MKIRKLLLTSFLVGTIFTLPLLKNVNSVSCDAAFVENDVFNENFNKKELDSGNWQLKDASFNVESYSLRMNPKTYKWGSMLLNQNLYIEDDFILDIDLKSLADNDTGGKWLGVAFGMKTIADEFANAPFAYIFYSSYACTNKGTYCDFEQSGYLQPYSNIDLFATPFSKYNTISKARFHIDIYDSLTSYIYFDILDEDGNMISEHSDKDIIKVNKPLTGYVGFNNSGVEVEIENFVVKDANTGITIYEDDFSNSSIQYSTSGSGAWKTNSFTTDDVVLGPVSNIKLNGNNSSLYYSNEISNANYDRVDISFKTSIDVNYLPMTTNSVCGIEFAKETINANGIIAGVKKEKFGYQLIVADKDRNVIAHEICSSDSPEYLLNLNLNYSNTGKAYFFTDDISIEFDCDYFDGFIGVTNFSIDGGACVGPEIDNFALSKVIDRQDESPDVSINFNGTKDQVIAQRTFKNYYISNREWTMSKTSMLTLSSYRSDDPNGYLCFNSADTTAVFGTINKYRDFVVRFDVEILTEVENLEEHAGFALEFGSSGPKTLFDNVQSLGLFSTDFLPNRASLIAPNLCKLEGGATSVDFPEAGGETYTQFFEKRDGKAPKLNVMYVVYDNEITMHFKYDNEPEDVLMEPRCRAYSDRGTDGYVYVVGSGSISFNLDNFSITNLDYISRNDSYTPFGSNDYQITTRKDFTAKEDFSGLNLTNANYFKKALRINDGGKASTIGETSNGLYRINFKDIESKCVLTFGNASISLSDDKYGKRIIANDNTSEQIFDLGNDFSFENSNLEIFKQGSNFYLKIISGNTPLSAITGNPILLNLETGNYYNLFEISSKGFADINSFLFINFDSHQTIQTRNYDPAIDEFDVWVERTPIQEKDKKSGCGSSIVASSFIICISAFALICLTVLKRRISYENK